MSTAVATQVVVDLGALFSGERLYHACTGEKLSDQVVADLAKQPRSLSSAVTELTVFGTDETLKMSVVSSTQVIEVKQLLAQRLGIDPSALTFLTKQGCLVRRQYDTDEIARKVSVKGIASFRRARKIWEHPIAIIGTGHSGLRQAMWFLKHGETNFVLYDRRHDVGGTSWWDSANAASKLQTELGTYHLQYDEDNPVPKNMPTWPNRAELLRHFREVSEEYGIIPYCRFKTDVAAVTVEKADARERPADQWYVDQTYRFSLKDLESGGQSEVQHSCLCYFPGNLTVPKEEQYTGEDQFGGFIAYAVANAVDYTMVAGEEVALVGHGAFAVENVRTCCEYGARKVWMICRRRNLACPRVSSWFINQSKQWISGPLYMRCTEPMYKLTPFDPWDYHSVFANQSRTMVTITQKARFGIGDVYFLAIAMGLLEVLEDSVKRLSHRTIHLESGQKLEVGILLKLFGFSGAWEVDRLVGCKEMEGNWVNGDFRRFLCAEAIGVNAQNFGGTSFSPGVRSWVEQSAYFFWYPKDFQAISQSGMLPRHKAEQDKDRPAFVIDARYANTTGMLVGGMCPGLAEASAATTFLKSRKQLECHPMRAFVDECRSEWDDYARKWKANGAPGLIPEYPYTYEVVESLLAEEAREFAALQSR